MTERIKSSFSLKTINTEDFRTKDAYIMTVYVACQSAHYLVYLFHIVTLCLAMYFIPEVFSKAENV